MAEQQKSGTQKAARGAQVVGGIVKIATGIASQNYAQAIVGAIEVIPWKKVLTVIGALLFLLLIPIIIIFSLPGLLVKWSLSEFDDLIFRNEHASEMESYYYEVLGEQEDGVDPDITRLICIQAVQKLQQIESIAESDVRDMIEISFSVDDETGEVYNKTSDEIMDEMGFTDEQKTYDYNTFGVWLKVVQMGIYFNYDWGSYGTIRLFLGGFNVSLCVNDPISRCIRFCR